MGSAKQPRLASRYAVLVAAAALVPAGAAPAQGGPSLRIDVAAAAAAAGPPAATVDADGTVHLPGVVVQGRRPLSNTLPCIGCEAQPKVPMRLLLDLADHINAVFVVPSGRRPDDTADAALIWAHYNMCVPDNPLGCAYRPQDP
jgi:hypothetical protein